MKMKKVLKKKFEYLYTKTWLVIILLVIIQHLLQREGELLTLNEKIFNIYSFIATILSLFGIYFALIQFCLESKKNGNTFYGINYATEEINNSAIYSFFKSKSFLIYLLIFSFLPLLTNMIDCKFEIVFFDCKIIPYYELTFLWNSIFCFIFFTYVLSLYKTYRFVLTIDDKSFECEKRKSDYCYKICKQSIEEMFDYFFKSYHMIQTSNDFVAQALYSSIFKYLNSSIKDWEEVEKNYYLNNIFEGITVYNEAGNISLSKTVFLRNYLNILLDNNIYLVMPDRDKDFFYYPVLNIIRDNLVISKSEDDDLFKDFVKLLNNQNSINIRILWNLILDDKTQNNDYLDIIINYLIEHFSATDIEFLLLNDGQNFSLALKKGVFDIKKAKKIFNIWMLLFDKMKRGDINLILPEHGVIHIDGLTQKNVYFDMNDNLYCYACYSYIKKCSDSYISEKLRGTLFSGHPILSELLFKLEEK